MVSYRLVKRGAKSTKRRRLVRRILLVVVAALVLHEAWLFAKVIRVRSGEVDHTAMMRERVDALEGELEIDQRWRPLSEISPHLVRAVIAAEDIHFPDHSGIDFDALAQAASRNRSAGKVVAGGSTITQQLAKNLFLSSKQSYRRKAREAVFAYELERVLGKRRIMEVYLNVIEWGDGIYGAEAASQHYFKKSASKLSPLQAAYLAAIIPGPREALNPRKHPERHRTAKERIQRGMKLVPDDPLP